VAETGKNIEEAARLLSQGQLVAIPTETVYGLAANALDETAVLAIFAAKNRPFFDPLIVHTHNIESLYRYAVLSDERLRLLAQHFWPGPLTLLLPKTELIPDLVTSGLNQVAIRIPNHPLTLRLLQSLPFPLAAPSANPFGYVSPTQSSHVNDQLGKQVAYILEGGPSTVGLESTIVGMEDQTLCIYRLGGLAIEDIENVAGPAELRLNQSSNPKAPGQLKSHYAPKTKLLLGPLNALLQTYAKVPKAVLYMGPSRTSEPNTLFLNLSESSNLNEAAIQLFKLLRMADNSGMELVLCEEVPEIGLGRAINDRLRRAATRE
jgi:L-threonylcarbamoyladenylate synthase